MLLSIQKPQRLKTKFLIPQVLFNKLTKISFDARMKEAVKSLASKSQINNALDITDKKRGKIKNFKRLIKVILLVKVTLVMIGHGITWYFN